MTAHVVDPATSAPMSTDVDDAVPVYGLAPVQDTETWSSAVVADGGREYERTARPLTAASATDDGAAGAECTVRLTGAVVVSANVTKQNHWPAAALTVCPAEPVMVDVPFRQSKELLPAAMEIVPAPPVRPVDAAAWGRACTTTGCPHAPLIEPRAPRARHVQRPGFPAMDASPGAEPVATRLSPPDEHDTVHEVESAPRRPTRTATRPAVAARHGVNAGGMGATMPLKAGGAVSIGSVDEATDRESTTAPWVKFVPDVHVDRPPEHRSVPVESRTSDMPIPVALIS